jgi:preprotein translocase subunit SecA
MLQRFVKLIGGDPNKKEIEKLYPIVDQINALEPQFEALSDEALRAKTDEFRARLAAELRDIEDEKERDEVAASVLDDLLPEAFAAVREASKRTIGLRHYDVQLIGGVVLHRGSIAEMRTGEGKTLVASLPLYLNALEGRGVHLVTVNDYLARRDARWMGPIYHALGLSVGILQMAAVTENGKKAFQYDPESNSSQEDKDKLRLVDRRLAYEADITYGTNSEFGFDYLRDNMTMSLAERTQRGHRYAIVDEVDNVLIDEARTPLIISGPAAGDLEWYGRMAQLVRQLKPEDYEVNEKERAIALTEIGITRVEQMLGQSLQNPDRPEDVTPEQARLMGYLEQALRAQYLFKRNKDYLVQGSKVIIVDEFTGRLMPGRRWSDGLHQAVEAKEGVKVEPENITYATITLQNYFRMYHTLAGMTGTALTEAEEFFKIYKLEVLPIPTNLEYQAARPDSPLVEVKARDEDGYEFAYFAHRTPATRDNKAASNGEPLFYRRKDFPDLIYRTVEAKLRAIVTEIVRYHVMGRPILVGTTSVESSERLSERLRAEPIRRLAQVMLIRDAWMAQNNREEDGRLIPELVPLNEPITSLEAGALRQFARPLNLSTNAEEPENLQRLVRLFRLEAEHADRLRTVLQGGVPHQVLNARRHTEESQIIAGAGAFGAVTIATNMAGRGVDIKLGGDLAEEIVSAVNRVLRKTGVEDPYDLTMEERRAALLAVEPEQYGIYEIEVKFFLQYFNDMEAVRERGGLHVIGSERHDARRIDNQLRGRSARQGDPGSSRFYLSLEDDLMRMFGGDAVGNLMKRIQVDDSLPLENRLVGNMIEQSQHRVEGANFDVRKHLLEYDDVLNAQRQRIYEQRDRVFTKEDLHDDVTELLRTEIHARVPVAFADEDGPWKLLSWLEQIQPPFGMPSGLFPSFSYRILLDELREASGDPREELLELTKQAIEAEQTHLLNSIEYQIEKTGESLENQLEERFDALDVALENLSDPELEPRRPQELLEELSNAARMQLRLPTEHLRRLAEDPSDLEEPLKDQIESALTNIAVIRMIGAIEARLGEPLGLDKDKILRAEWSLASEQILEAARRGFDARRERLVGDGGQIARDIDALLARQDAASLDESGLLRVLTTLTLGARTSFNAKTHRQERQMFQRFSYIFHAARLLEDRNEADVTADVLEHLEAARSALEKTWGQAEFGHISQNAQRLEDFGPAIEAVGPLPVDATPATLTESQRTALADELGRRTLTNIHRGILLQVITELWVEYLTRIEALRVSIGLEAYGQRDPLVQYKSKASEMFGELLREIRAAVISRMYIYQPRQATAVATLEPASTEPAAVAEVSTATAQASAVTSMQPSGKKKRKRH